MSDTVVPVDDVAGPVGASVAEAGGAGYHCVAEARGGLGGVEDCEDAAVREGRGGEGRGRVRRVRFTSPCSVKFGKKVTGSRERGGKIQTRGTGNRVEKRDWNIAAPPVRPVE